MPTIALPTYFQSFFSSPVDSKSQVLHEENNSTTKIVKIAVRMIQSHVKNFFKCIRFTAEWMSMSIKSLKNHASLINLSTFMKTGESALDFSSFTTNIIKMPSTIFAYVKGTAEDAFFVLFNTTMDLLWNTFKVVKALKIHKIVQISTRNLIPFQVLGGTGFAVSSCTKLVTQFKKFDENMQRPVAEDKTQRDKDSWEMFRRVNLIVKNICTLAIATILVIGPFTGFYLSIVPNMLLGTAILATDICAETIRFSFDF
jgi:hypothetical protein